MEIREGLNLNETKNFITLDLENVTFVGDLLICEIVVGQFYNIYRLIINEIYGYLNLPKNLRHLNVTHVSFIEIMTQLFEFIFMYCTPFIDSLGKSFTHLVHKIYRSSSKNEWNRKKCNEVNEFSFKW